MTEQLVLYSYQDQVALIELANPDKKNALNKVLLNQLKEAFLTAENDDNVRAVVLMGKSEIFCAGMDIEWLLEEDSVGMIKENIFIQDIFTYIGQFRKPIVSSLNGSALGAGLMLALITDYRIAAEEALIGFPEIKIGIPIFLAGSKILQRYLNIAQIKDLLFTGRLLTATEGMKLNLINHVEPKKNLGKAAMSLAQSLAQSSPIALQILKRSINAGYEMSEKAVLTSELEALGFFWGTEDRKEGLKSFLEKKKPKFKGK